MGEARSDKKKFSEASRLYAQGEYQQALMLLEELRAAYPGTQNIMFPIALCLRKLGKHQEAVRLCKELVEKFQHSKAKELKQEILANLRQQRKTAPLQTGSLKKTPSKQARHAKNGNEPRDNVRRRGVFKLKREELMTLAENDPDEAVREAAARRLEEAYPKWQHPNPEVRLQAIAELCDEKILSNLAQGHADEAVREAASQRRDQVRQENRLLSSFQTFNTWKHELTSDEIMFGLVRSVCLSSDGRLVLAAGTETVKVWSAETGSLLRTYEGHAGESCCQLHSVNISEDGQWVLSGSAGSVQLWNVETGECTYTFRGPTPLAIESSHLSANAQWALSGGVDKTVRIWEPKHGGRRSTLKGHTDGVNAVCLSADSRWALSGSLDKTVRLWNVESGECTRILEGSTGGVRAVCLSADGRRALSGGGDSTVRLWDLEAGIRIHTLIGHTGDVTSVSMSADGRWALSGSSESSVRLWDLEAGKCMRTFEERDFSAYSVFLSADARWGVSGGYGDTVNLLRLAPLTLGEPPLSEILASHPGALDVARDAEPTLGALSEPPKKSAELKFYGRCSHRAGVCPKCCLHCAVEAGSISDVRSLLAANADPNLLWVDGGPLHYIWHGPEYGPDTLDSLLRILIEAGADIEQRNYYEQTPLHLAVVNGRLPVIERLLAMGASRKTTDLDGNNLLHSAVLSDIPRCQQNRRQIISALIESGVSTLDCNARGETPKELAKSKGRSGSVVRML